MPTNLLMPPSLASPSYRTGFARSAGESQHPELWRGLVSAWPALGPSGKLRDVIKGNDGALTNFDISSAWSVDSNGHHLLLDGTNDHVLCDSSPVSGSQSRTIVMRIRADSWLSGDGDEGHFVSIAEAGSVGGTGERWTIRPDNASGSTAYLRVEIQGSGYTTTGLPMTEGTWHTIACVLNGTTLGDHELYVDGRAESATGSGSVNTHSDSKIYFGSRSDLNSAWFHEGGIGTVLLYNRALSSNELRVLTDPLAPFRQRSRVISYPTTATPAPSTQTVISIPRQARPSYKSGYARNAAESVNPGLWADLRHAHIPLFGVTGNTLHDLVGGATATLKNNVPWEFRGKAKGHVIDHDDLSSHWIDLGAPEDANPGTGDFTALVYLIGRAQASTSVRPYQKRGTGGWTSQAGWQLAWRGGSDDDWANTGVSDGSDAVRISNGQTFTWEDDKLHVIAMRWRNGSQELKLFLDGVDQSLTTQNEGGDPVDNVTTTRNLTIGAAWNDVSTQSQYWDGELLGAMYYGRALSERELFVLGNDFIAPFRLKPYTVSFPAAEAPAPSTTTLITVSRHARPSYRERVMRRMRVRVPILGCGED